jgi:hypothetical protein
MDEDSEQRRGFQVRDRRRFSETGDTRTGSEGEPEERHGAGPPPPVASPETDTPPAPADEPVSFSTFVLGLSTQALLHLGEIPDLGTRLRARDLPAAKQVIDILGILRDKTRNNLEPTEQSLLDSVLYDLRMRYVELVRPGVKEAT